MHIDMKKTGKGKIFIIIAVIFLAAAAAVGIFLYGVSGRERLHLRINGSEISEEEYLQAVKAVRYDVAAYFAGTYGALEEGSFWSEEYGGEIPCEKLADEAVERLKYIHAVYGLAEEKGYIDDAGYDALVERLEDENASRKEKIEAREPVYGLSEYTLDLFMEYEVSSFRERYCNDKTNEGMDLTEEEILAYYESREWTLGDSGETADLETARIAVERELREKKYDEIIAQREADSQVETDREELYRFTLKNI